MKTPLMHVEDKAQMIGILQGGGSLISAGKTLRQDREIIKLALSKNPQDIAFVPRLLQEDYQEYIDATLSHSGTNLTAEDISSIIDKHPLAKRSLKNEEDESMAFEICEIENKGDNIHFKRKLREFIDNPLIEKQAFLITIDNTHWVSLLFKKSDTYIEYQYGDSLFNSINNTLKEYIPDHVVRKDFSATRQETGANNCGIHAIFDLVAMFQGKNRSTITTSDAKKN